jgi:acyl-coenzyme A synthetase/AMP-(fatty) acid ligase
MPEEVEQALEQHSSVSEAAVFRVKEKFGKRLKRSWSPKARSRRTSSSHTSKGISPSNKVPREIEFVEDLPATRRAMSTRSSSGRATTGLTPTGATANRATSAGLVRWSL